MNADVIKGKWQQLKGEAKIQWAKLTDDDLEQVEGNAQKLTGLLQERYGYAKDRAQQEVDDFFASSQEHDRRNVENSRF